MTSTRCAKYLLTSDFNTLPHGKDFDMTKASFSHTSVLLFECIEALNIRDGYTYVDCTAGGGGHSLEIAKRMGKNSRLICFDRDKNAIAAATERLSEYLDRVTFVNDNFSSLGKVLKELNIENLDSASEIRYSKKNSLSLAQNVDLVLKISDEEALRSKKEGDFVSIMKTTPSVITENVEDAESLEIIMRFDAFYLATRKSGVLEGHYPDYGETMKRLPEIISNPLAIVRMNNKRLNLLAVVPHNKGDNNIISLELNTVKDINPKTTNII